jgi:hypothetical protein
MSKKVLLWGVLGGILLFVWGAISHMALGLYESSVKNLPGEETLLPALQSAIPERGFYFFPGMDKGADAAAQAKWAEKMKTGPSGILIYRPSGAEAMSPRLFVTELLSNIAAVLVGAFLLSQATGLGFGGRVLFMTLLGFFAWLMVNVSLWNWYGFPTAYLWADFVDMVVGSLLVGLLLAWAFRPRPA